MRIFSKPGSKRKALYIVLFLALATAIPYAGWRLSSEQSSSDTRTSASAASLGITVPIRNDTDDIYPSLSSKSMVDVMVKSSNVQILKDIQSEPYDIMCIALSLSNIEDTIDITDANGVHCDYIGYNPEQNGKTPQDELDNFIDTITTAKSMAEAYGALLLVGPGYGYMSTPEQEALYDEAAQIADAWMLQSQTMQLFGRTRYTPEQYQTAVMRVLNKLYAGNPNLDVWVQLSVTPPGPGGLEDPFSATDIYEYADIISDSITGIRVYDNSDPIRPETLRQVVAAIEPSVPPDDECASATDCMWCGSSCVLKGTRNACITLMPPTGYTCTCVSGTCTKKPK